MEDLLTAISTKPSLGLPIGKARQLRRQQIVLFCLFSTTLRRIARHLPWSTLTLSEKRQLDSALEALESDVALARSVTCVGKGAAPQQERAAKVKVR